MGCIEDGGVELLKRKLTVGDLRRANVPERYWDSSLKVVPDKLEHREKIRKYVENLPEMLEKGVGLYLWSDENGTGKAQPLDAKVLTKDGFRDIGTVRVGDKIVADDGTMTEVIGVYPQGLKPSYEMELLDGRKVRCCNEHLWTVYKGNGGIRTVTTQNMIDEGLRSSTGKAYKFFVPNNKAVQFENSTVSLPIDPYVLGVLIGDGSISERADSVEISTSEEDVISRVRCRLGADYSVDFTRSNNYSWIVKYLKDYKKNPLKDALRNLKLRVKSVDKFIPKEYLISDIGSRRELLMGLFDTDGSIAPNGSYRYSTRSRRLAEDIMFLCRSLGYQCKMSTLDRGQRGIDYEVRIYTHDKIFKSAKHTLRYKVGNGKNSSKYHRTAIKSIRYVGEEEMVCIQVKNPRQLYLTDEFIVTHNTSIASLIAKEALRYGRTAFFEESSRLKTRLVNKEAFEEGTSVEARIEMVDLLVLDDIGKEYRTNSGYAENLIETLVRNRVQKVRTTIMTGNVPPRDLQKLYSEDFSALMKESMIPINITGYDFREAKAKSLRDLL